MADGLLNVCKECSKARSRARHYQKMSDPVLHETEKLRIRVRYQKLYSGGRRKQPPKEVKRRYKNAYINKYPEKKKASVAISDMQCPKGYQNHHWSYNDEHLKDVFQLPIMLHYKIHLYMVYQKEKKIYATRTGFLLDTRKKHEDFIKLIERLP